MCWQCGQYPQYPVYPTYPTIVVQPQKNYGFFNFLFDVFMILITYGFWLIWIFVREMRRNRRPRMYC